SEVENLIIVYANTGARKGQMMDVLDRSDTWCVATVLDDEIISQLKVHFCAWPKHNEEMVPSYRVAPLFTHTQETIDKTLPSEVDFDFLHMLKERLTPYLDELNCDVSQIVRVADFLRNKREIK